MAATGLIAAGLLLAGLCAVGAFVLMRRSRVAAIALGCVAVALFAISATPVVLALTIRMPQPALWSNTLDGSTVGVWIEAEHERLAFDGSITVFRYGDGWDALVTELEQDYPEGEIEDDAWVVARPSLRYRVASGDPTGTFEGEDVYTLAPEVMTVLAPEGAFEVPFPVAALVPDLGVQRVRLGDTVVLVDGVDLPGYYRSIGTGVCDGGSCIVPTSTGGLASVTATIDGRVTVGTAAAG